MTPKIASDVATQGPRLTLIFDDGPRPDCAPAFLDLFAREGVRVNFAHVGKYVRAAPSLVREVQAAGHEVVNHSMTHPHFNDLESAQMRQELLGMQTLVREAGGVPPRWFWPPFGDRLPKVVETAAAAGVPCFPLPDFHFQSIEDWNVEKDADAIYAAATRPHPDRCVLCFHEWRRETLQVMPQILDVLKSRGAQFLTFSEMAETNS